MTTQTIPVAELDKAGLIADNPSVNLPPNAFSDALNVRFKDGAVRKIKGHKEIFEAWDTDTRILHTGYWANPNGATYVVVALDSDSTTRANVYTMTSDDDGNAVVSRRSVNTDGTVNPMTHSDDAHWQTVSFNGGYSIIINNGIETPRHITDTLGGDSSMLRTEVLPGWDDYMDSDVRVARVTAGNIIATGNLLLAGNLTEYDSEDNVHRDLRGVVRSSDVAEPGAIPDNWDPFQTAVNTADEITIADTGQITAMAQLQGNIYVYTADSINQLRITTQGLQQSPVTSNYGCLGRDMLMEFDGSHLVVGSDDIYLFAGHPGNIQSVADGRVRRLFYEDAHYFYIEEGAIIRNQAYDEIWICYAPNTSGNGRYTTALIWNYRNNTWTKRDLPEASSITVGPIPGGGSDQSRIEFAGSRSESAAMVAGVQEIQTFTVQSGSNAQERFRRPEVQTLTVDNTAQVTGERRVPEQRSLTVATNASVSDAHDRHESQQLSISEGTMRGADSVAESQTITVASGLDADVISDGHQEQQRITLSGTDANTVDSAAAQTHRYRVTFNNEGDGAFSTGVSSTSNSYSSPLRIVGSTRFGPAGYSGIAESRDYFWTIGWDNVTFSAPFSLNTTRLKRTDKRSLGNLTNVSTVPGTYAVNNERVVKLAARPDNNTHLVFTSRQGNTIRYSTNGGSTWGSYSWSGCNYCSIVHTGGRWYALHRNGNLYHSTSGMPTSSGNWTQITTSGLSTSDYASLFWLPQTQKLMVMMGSANGVGYVHGANGTTFTSISSTIRCSGADEDATTGTIFVMGDNGCRKTSNGYDSSPTWSSVSLSGTGPSSNNMCMVTHQGRGNWMFAAWPSDSTGDDGSRGNWSSSSTSISRTAIADPTNNSTSDVRSAGFVNTYKKYNGRPIWTAHLTLSTNQQGIHTTRTAQYPLRIIFDQNTANVTPTAGGSARLTDWTYNAGTSVGRNATATAFGTAADTQFSGVADYTDSVATNVVTLDTGQHTALSGSLRYDFGSGYGSISLATNRTGRSKRNASLYQVRDERNQQIALLTGTSRETKLSLLRRIHAEIDGHTSSSTPAITWSAVLDSDNFRINLTSDGNTNVSGTVNVNVSNGATTGDYAAAADGDVTSASSVIQNGAAPSAANATLNVLIPGTTAAGDVNQSVTLSNTLPAYGSDPVNLNSDDIYDAVKAAVIGNSQTLWTIDTEDRTRTVTFTGVNNQTDFPSQAAITVTNANISGLTNSNFSNANNPRGVYADGTIVVADPNDSEYTVRIGDGTEGLTYGDTDIMEFIHANLNARSVKDWTYNGQSNNNRTLQYTREVGSNNEFANYPDNFVVKSINYGVNSSNESLGTGNTLDTDNFASVITQGLNVPEQQITVTLPDENAVTVTLEHPNDSDDNTLLQANGIATAIRTALSGGGLTNWTVNSGTNNVVTVTRTSNGNSNGVITVTAPARARPDGSSITDLNANQLTDSQAVAGYDTDAPVLRIQIPTDNIDTDYTIVNDGDPDGTLIPINTLVSKIVAALPTLSAWTAASSSNVITLTGTNDTEGHAGLASLTVRTPGSLSTLTNALANDDVAVAKTTHRDIQPLSVRLYDPESADTETVVITEGHTDGRIYRDSDIARIIVSAVGGSMDGAFDPWVVTRASNVITFTQNTARHLDGVFSAVVDQHPENGDTDTNMNSGSFVTGNLSPAAVTRHGRDTLRPASVTITPLNQRPTTLIFDTETQTQAATRVYNFFNTLEGYTPVQSGSSVTVTSQIFGEGNERSFAIESDPGTEYVGGNNFSAAMVPSNEWVVNSTFALQETDPERPWPRNELNEARNYVVWSTDYNFYGGDLGYAFDTEAYSSYIERRHFHMSPTKDVESLRAVGIHAMSDSDSETLEVAVTTSNRVQEPVNLMTPQYVFNLDEDYKVDVRETGRMLNIRMSHSGTTDWELAGYDLEIGKGGER